ncbi:hypothetical protein Q3G72_000464 [Acer saccharum]|nr:hypothetical protein Q3G72_000464 [Acer saccharum]
MILARAFILNPSRPSTRERKLEVIKRDVKPGPLGPGVFNNRVLGIARPGAPWRDCPEWLGLTPKVEDSVRGQIDSSFTWRLLNLNTRSY